MAYIQPAELIQPRALVHIVDMDDEVHRFLTRWLATAGIESRSYGHVGEFLAMHRAEQPGCLVIDAHALATGRLVTAYPIVVTACQADVAMAVTAMKTGAVDFVEKPLREPQIVTAIGAAIEVDRKQRPIAARHTALLARFSTMSRRERQVMKLVTAGRLNKQIGAELGLSEITVKAHRGAVMRKMAARSLAELVRMADALCEEFEALEAPVRNDNSRPTRRLAAADRHNGYDSARN